MPKCFHADLDLILLEDPCADGWRPIHGAGRDFPIDGMPLDFMLQAAVALGRFHLQGFHHAGNSFIAREYFANTALVYYQHLYAHAGRPSVQVH